MKHKEILEFEISEFVSHINNIRPKWELFYSEETQDGYVIVFKCLPMNSCKWYNIIYRSDLDPVWQIQRHGDGIVESFYTNDKIDPIFK